MTGSDDAPSLGDRIDAAAGLAPDSAPFLIVDGTVLTHGDIRDRVARLGHVLAAKGIAPDQHLGILSNSAEDVAALLIAGLRAGCAVINLAPDLTPAERDLAVRAARLDHLIADTDLLAGMQVPTAVGRTEIARPAAQKSGGLVKRLLAKPGAAAPPRGLHAEMAAVADATPLPAPRRASDATALMLLTSGTTSQPKVVTLSGRALMAQIETFERLYRYGPDCRILNPLPLHFTDGLLHGPILTYLTGATLLRPARFSFDQTGALLDRIGPDRVTHFIVVPALLSLMRRLGGQHDTAFQTPDFRYIRSSGDRLPEPIWAATEDRFGVRVINTYGLSETVCEALFCGPDDATYRRGTVGKPVDCAARILGPDGADVPDGDTGELWLSGPNIMTGYLGQPGLTADVLQDGWFCTGDLACRDSDGFVTITGRRKALIVSGGINVQPQDVVDVMLRHGDVAEAHVLGLPDPDFNEVVGCAVVLTQGVDMSEPMLADLMAHAQAHLAARKVPRRIVVVPQLPRNAAGKVRPAAAAALFEAEARPAPSGAGDPLARVIGVAATVLNCPTGDLDAGSTPFNTPGWDSLAHLALVSAVEADFGVTLATAEIMEIGSLGDLARIAGQA